MSSLFSKEALDELNAKAYKLVLENWNSLRADQKRMILRDESQEEMHEIAPQSLSVKGYEEKAVDKIAKSFCLDKLATGSSIACNNERYNAFKEGYKAACKQQATTGYSATIKGSCGDILCKDGCMLNKSHGQCILKKPQPVISVEIDYEQMALDFGFHVKAKCNNQINATKIVEWIKQYKPLQSKLQQAGHVLTWNKIPNDDTIIQGEFILYPAALNYSGRFANGETCAEILKKGDYTHYITLQDLLNMPVE